MPRRKPVSCDFSREINTTRKDSVPSAVVRSRLMRHNGGFGWRGVSTERYKHDDGTWADVIRRTLVGGEQGESTKFHLRYFEISPGGRTSHESHGHEHVVIVVRGKGRCRVRDRSYELGFLDTFYVSADSPHQFSNPYDEPFGFFCIVDAKRDRPRPEPK